MNSIVTRTSASVAMAALVLLAPVLSSTKFDAFGSKFSQSAQAGEMGMHGMHGNGMRPGGMMRDHGSRMGGSGALAAGMLGLGVLSAISSASIEDPNSGDRKGCINVCGVHVHTSNMAGDPPVQVVKPSKLKRVNCANGRCKPIPYGPYTLWPYEDANGNKYAKLTDADGNNVDTGSGPAKVNGYRIIK